MSDDYDSDTSPPELPPPSAPAAGWYPDPIGAAGHRFWDGEKWTDQTNKGRRQRGWSAAVLPFSGIALAVSPFLTWTKVFLLGNLSLFQLLRVDGHSTTLAWLFVVSGFGATAWGWFAPRTGRVASILIGLVVGFLAVVLLINLRREVNEIHEVASLGIGAWLAPVACVGLIIGGFVASDPDAKVT